MQVKKQEEIVPLPPTPKPRFTWRETEPEEPAPAPSFRYHPFAPGSSSKKLLADVERLITAHEEHAAKARRLEAEVEERRAELADLRALALVGQATAADVKIAEKALAALGAELEVSASIVAGAERQLPRLLEELAAAQQGDVEAALGKNAKALEQARAAFLAALEPGAAALVQQAGPLLEKWRELLGARLELYGQGGDLSNGRPDTAGRRMRSDPLGWLFGQDYDQAAVLDLLEILLPLVIIGPGGWPRVQGRPTVRGLDERQLW